MQRLTNTDLRRGQVLPLTAQPVPPSGTTAAEEELLLGETVKETLPWTGQVGSDPGACRSTDGTDEQRSR